MADVFEDRRDLDRRREMLWQVIESTPNLDWLLLTKRPENVHRLAPWRDVWPNNVWLGATAETQKWLDQRMATLTQTAAKVLFLSCEPLLGPLNLSRWVAGAEAGACRSIDWIIGGGESGHRARPMHPEWLTSLRDQCVDAGIRFHFKQWGNWRPVRPREANGYPTRELASKSGDRITIANMGKKAAGRKLQGTTWDQFPDGAATQA